MSAYVYTDGEKPSLRQSEGRLVPEQRWGGWGASRGEASDLVPNRSKGIRRFMKAPGDTILALQGWETPLPAADPAEDASDRLPWPLQGATRLSEQTCNRYLQTPLLQSVLCQTQIPVVICTRCNVPGTENLSSVLTEDPESVAKASHGRLQLSPINFTSLFPAL